MASEPRHHHVVPQFFLRNFAVDDARSRITTVAKHGDRAVWAERPIRGLGYERDFYVHTVRGVPVSLETDIERTIETPISQSDTWAKIATGRSDALDQSDRAILYALIRHLEVRTPQYEATGQELAQMAGDPENSMPFSDEEREMYAVHRARPIVAKAMFNAMAATPFDKEEFCAVDDHRGALADSAPHFDNACDSDTCTPTRQAGSIAAGNVPVSASANARSDHPGITRCRRL